MTLRYRLSHWGGLLKALSLRPNPHVRAGAQAYNRRVGLPPIVEDHDVKVGEPRARAIADAYEQLPTASDDPEMLRAYTALGNEVQDHG